MSEVLDFTVGKFTFKIAVDCIYTPEGVWVREQGNTLIVGVSDFMQQRSGDVAFADVKPPGTQLVAGEEFAVLETIKVDLSLGAPASGELVKVNSALESAAELINQDPYGAGWLAEIQPAGWALDSASLLSPSAYLALAQAEAERETRLE